MQIKHKIPIFVIIVSVLLFSCNIVENKAIEVEESPTELSRQFLAIYLAGQDKSKPELEHELKSALALHLPSGSSIHIARLMLMESGFTINPFYNGNPTPHILSATKSRWVTHGILFRTWSSVSVTLHGSATGTITSQDVKLCYSFPTGC